MRTALLASAGTGLLERPRPSRPRRGAGQPPRPPGGHGGEGGGGGDPGGPPEPARRPAPAALLAFAFVLVGIATLFLAFLLAFVLLRRNAGEWPPAGAPLPPKGLWASTATILASSFTLSRASHAPSPASRRRRLATTLALGLAFLLLQALLWRDLLRAGLTTDSSAYGALFYSLTGLHALHLVAGLVFLGVALALRSPHPTTQLLCALYWHFLGALWLVLFAVLYFS
jgi:cytochrome c oxidase subunit 3